MASTMHRRSGLAALVVLGLALLLCCVVLAATHHTVDAAPAAARTTDKAADKAAKEKAARERELAQRRALEERRREQEKAARRARRKKEREERQRVAERRAKQAAADAKLDPATRKKNRRAARRADKQRIAKRKADRVKTRLTAAVKRNAASRKARLARLKQRREARRHRLRLLDRFVADLRSRDSVSTRATALTKVRALARKCNGTSNHVWGTLRDDDFTEYVLNGPRPYGLVLALTALQPHAQCTVCRDVHALFGQLATDLLWADASAIMASEFNSSVTAKSQQRAAHALAQAQQAAAPESLGLQRDESPWSFQTKTVPGAATTRAEYDGGAPEPGARVPVFVVEVDFERAQQTFHALGLRGAPLVVYVPPRLSALAPAGADGTVRGTSAQLRDWVRDLSGPNTFPLQHDTKLADLVAWVNKVTHKHLSLPPPPLSRYWFTLVPAATVLALVLFLARSYLFRVSYVFKFVALVGGLLLLGFCWGGGWYSRLNDLAFDWKVIPRSWSQLVRFKFAEHVQRNSGNSQNGVEGYLFGCASLAMALLLVALTKRARMRVDRCGATDLTRAAAAAAVVGSSNGHGDEAKRDEPTTAADADTTSPAAQSSSWLSTLALLPWYALYFVASLCVGPLPRFSAYRDRSTVVRAVMWTARCAWRVVTSPAVCGLVLAYAWVTLVRVYTLKNGSYHYGMLHRVPISH